MSDDLKSIRRELNAIKQMLEISDLVNRKIACEILDIDSKTLTNYIGVGKVKIASVNDAGQKFFSRRELLGVK